MIRRTHTLVTEYVYVSRTDEAVDKDDPEFEEKWRLFLDGAASAPLKAGATPTLFTLRHLGAKDKDKLSPYLGKAADDGSYGARACFAACALALIKADNWGEAGKLLRLKFEDDDGVRLLSAESLEELGHELCCEIGSVAIARLYPRPN